MFPIERSYSTTKLLANNRESRLLNCLPPNPDRKIEGGLRFENHIKKTYSDKPLITVITVVFNGEAYIEETIKSVIHQTYDNVEYIIIDGNSSDNTCNIVEHYQYCIDYYISEEDKGIYDAMNKGIDAASGELIAFLNADDFYDLNALERIVKQYMQEDSDFIYGDLNIVDMESNLIAKFYADLSIWKRTMPFGHPTLFVRSSLLKTLYFDLQYKVSSDYDLILRLMLMDLKHGYVSAPIANFRTGGVSSNINLFTEIFPIHKKHFGLPLAVVLYLQNNMIAIVKKSLKKVLSPKNIKRLKQMTSKR